VLPAWLYASLARGLSTDPNARFPSMVALLVSLEPRRGRVRLPALALLGLLSVLVFFGSLLAITTASAPANQPAPSAGPVREDGCASPAIDAASPRSFLRSCNVSILECESNGWLHIAASCRRLDGSVAASTYAGHCDVPHRVQNCDGKLECGADCRY
jgi:hypothetical protein